MSFPGQNGGRRPAGDSDLAREHRTPAVVSGAALVLGTILSVVCAAACGQSKGRSSPSNPPSSGPSSGIAVTGNERLAWDQETRAGVHAGTLEYYVYVDSARMKLADVSCSAARDPIFECSARLPDMSLGRHDLRVISVDRANGVQVESARSDALVVTKVAGSAPSGQAVLRLSRSSSAATVVTDRDSTQAAATSPAGAAFLATPVAAAAGSVADLAVSAAGRLFAAERSGRVLSVDARSGQPVTALQLPAVDTEDGRGLYSIGLHPGFDANGLIYLLYAAQTSHGPVYRLVRGRELAGQIGQLAVLLDAAPAPPTSWAMLRFGPDDRLYVLLGDDPNYASGASSYGGKLLRLADDGTRAPDNPAPSPILANIPGVPSGLLWTDGGARLIEFESGDTHAIWWSEAGRSPTALALERGSRPAGLAYVADTSECPAGCLFVGELAGGVRRVAWPPASGRKALRTEEVLADQYGAVRALAAAPDGSLYFGTANADSGGPTRVLGDFIVRLTRRAEVRR